LSKISWPCLAKGGSAIGSSTRKRSCEGVHSR
jgi:hypothetical protein